MTKYQAIYEGQIVTEPTSFQDAIDVAIEENISAIATGHLPICEVTIAPTDSSAIAGWQSHQKLAELQQNPWSIVQIIGGK